MHDLMWLVTAASIIGTILNIQKKKICFLIWFCTNNLWMVYNLIIGSYPQAALFGVYVGLSVWGICKWRKER